MSRLSSTDTPVEEEAEVVESDEAREALLAKIQTELGDAVVGSHLSPGDDLWVRVDRSAWAATGAYLQTGLEVGAGSGPGAAVDADPQVVAG